MEEKKEITLKLSDSDFKAVNKLQKDLDKNINTLIEGIEKVFQVIFAKKTVLWWKCKTICLLVCLLVNVPGIAIALVFKDFSCIDDTVVYCLTAICITSIIACIICIIGYLVVFQNLMQKRYNGNKDS